MNEKLAGPEPTWGSFAGLSVLYDNPGTVLSPGLQRIDALPVADEAGQQLYDALEQVVATLSDGPLRRRGFCPLPRATYHVTVCDGVNDSVVTSVASPHRATVRDLLDDLPDSLLRPSLPAHLLRGCDLLPAVRATPCRLRVRELWIGQYVLAAGLEVADERSRRALGAHREARQRLAGQLRSVLGVSTQTWRPHVSLGYFTNLDEAAAARDALAGIADRVVGAGTDGLTATFRSASVYGFTDMVTYWRAEL